jgi:hypothetical protein
MIRIARIKNVTTTTMRISGINKSIWRSPYSFGSGDTTAVAPSISFTTTL